MIWFLTLLKVLINIPNVRQSIILLHNKLSPNYEEFHPSEIFLLPSTAVFSLKIILFSYFPMYFIQTFTFQENLEMCINLIALYLYDNKIEKIENLATLEQLSCLYLQNNRIQKVENLQELTQLTVLWVTTVFIW